MPCPDKNLRHIKLKNACFKQFSAGKNCLDNKIVFSKPM
jgi:hypothetical protein